VLSVTGREETDVTSDDEREFGDFVVARSRRLCEFAYLLCGDWHNAEDAVQTALTKLFLAWRRVRDRGSIDPYVRKIIVHVLVDQRRLARFRRESSWAEPPEGSFAHDQADATPDRLAVLQALAKVAPRQRAVLVLRFWEDQSVEETAELLNCSAGTVKSQSARGLQTLRELLAHQFAV
jgi:RNA polymerase sigma-70 factor (sigma-E family)